MDMIISRFKCVYDLFNLIKHFRSAQFFCNSEFVMTNNLLL